MNLFLDSFDDRTANLVYKYDPIGGDSYRDFSSSSGRTGRAAQFYTDDILRKALPGPREVLFVGVAISVSFHGNTGDLIRFYDGSTLQCSLSWNYPANTLSIVNGASTVLGTTTYILPNTGVWVYLELYVDIHSTAGAYELRANGVTILNGTGANTQSSGSNQATSVALNAESHDSAARDQYKYDDFYINDNTGATNNGFLGSIKIECLRPNGAGALTQWTIGGSAEAATNWQSVDDASPDDGVTLAESASPGVTDIYALADMAATIGTVLSVQTGLRANADDSGPRSVQKVLRSGGANYAGAARSLTADWSNYYEIDELDPAIAGPWTIASINALEAGIEVAA